MKKNIFICYSIILPIMLSSLYCYNASAEPHFSPTVEMSTTFSGKRRVGEADIMIPFLVKESNLSILDIKIKQDNHESVEGNFGLVNRSNLAGRAILGLYGYFDRRRTKSYLTVNQLTLGAELLSPNLDLRVNAYFPETKQKELVPQRKKFVRDRTRVYVTQENAIKEAALPGFDFEIGTPLFLMLHRLDEQFGTRVYLAKYKFNRKNVSSNSGTRLRLEQKINWNLFDKKDSEITVNIGTSWERRKHNNFFGLGIKLALDKNYQKSSLTKLQRRMMDTVIRDIDIVMQRSTPQVGTLPLYWRGKEVRNLYFVGEKPQEGDGSYESPFSTIQLRNLLSGKRFEPTEYDMILPITIEDPFLTTDITDAEYQGIIKSCKAVGIKNNEPIELQTPDKTTFNIDNLPEYFPQYTAKKSWDNIVQTEQMRPLLTELYSTMEKIDKNFSPSESDIVFIDKKEYFSSANQAITNDSQWIVIVDSQDDITEAIIPTAEVAAAETAIVPLNYNVPPVVKELGEEGTQETAAANRTNTNVTVSKRYEPTAPSITQIIHNSINEEHRENTQRYNRSPGKLSFTQSVKKSLEDGSISSKRVYIQSPSKKTLTKRVRDSMSSNSNVKKKLF